jgi:hypothetical protein
MSLPIATGTTPQSGLSIPELWSTKIIEHLNPQLVLPMITNTMYSGEISKKGDKVIIRSEPEVMIGDYEPGMELKTEQPDTDITELLIDKAKYFALEENDVLSYQQDIKLMNLAANRAAFKMKEAVEKDVLTNILPDISLTNKGATAGALGGGINLGTTSSPVVLNKENVTDFIANMGTVLDEANCPGDSRFLIVPPRLANLVKRSELKDASLAGDGTSIYRNGRIGMLDRFMIYESHYLLRDSSNNAVHMIAGHKMGTSFVSQLTKVEQASIPKGFEKIIKGLNVYGYKVLYPDTLCQAVVQTNLAL